MVRSAALGAGSLCSNRASCVCITIWAYVNTVLPQIAALFCLSIRLRTIKLEDTGFNGILPVPFPPLSLALKVNLYIKIRKTLRVCTIIP